MPIWLIIILTIFGVLISAALGFYYAIYIIISYFAGDFTKDLTTPKPPYNWKFWKK